MPMKSLKIAIGIALSVVGVGSGVTFGVSNFVGNSESQVAAEDSGYVLEFNYSDTYPLTKVTGSSDKGQLLNFHINTGDEIVIRRLSDDTPIGSSYLSGGTAYSYFEEDGRLDEYLMALFGEEEGEGADYNIYLNSSEQIYIDFATHATVYLQLPDWGNSYLYAFDETTQNDYGVNSIIKPFGEWPGQYLNSASGNASFNQSGGIAKVEVPYAILSNMKIIINNNNSSQSGDLNLTNGAYYLSNASTGNSGDVDLGDAAEVVIEIVEEINNATNSSICNISSARAGELYSLYDELNATAKAAVNNSTLWTYKSADMSEGNADISFVDIVNRLSILSNNASSSNFILPLSKNEYGMTLLVSIISLLSVSIIVFFFIRRKRHQ